VIKKRANAVEANAVEANAVGANAVEANIVGANTVGWGLPPRKEAAVPLMQVVMVAFLYRH